MSTKVMSSVILSAVNAKKIQRDVKDILKKCYNEGESVCLDLLKIHIPVLPDCILAVFCSDNFYDSPIYLVVKNLDITTLSFLLQSGLVLPENYKAESVKVVACVVKSASAHPDSLLQTEEVARNICEALGRQYLRLEGRTFIPA